MTAIGAIPLMLLAATPSVRPALCSPEQIAATGHVVHRTSTSWPDYPKGPIPDAATLARRSAADAAAVGLVPLTEGLIFEGSDEGEWDGRACRVELVRVYGNSGVTPDGIVVYAGADSVQAERSTTPLADAEPAHPAVPGARFVGSTGVAVADWRVGIWQERAGGSLLAAYRPGIAGAPLAVLHTRAPVIGAFYLGSPDSVGGGFTLLQRLAPARYRWTRLSWGEKAIRAMHNDR